MLSRKSDSIGVNYGAATWEFNYTECCVYLKFFSNL